MSWASLLHTVHPRMLPTLLGKLQHRFEPETSAEATQWAKDQAISVATYCAHTAPSLWAETTQAIQHIEQEAKIRLQDVHTPLGGGGAYPLLYFLVRQHCPRVVVETGVAFGWSSRTLLGAMAQNGEGQLWSSDFPYLKIAGAESLIGQLVSHQLKPRWHLDIRGDRVAIPNILQQVGQVDLFHYDSDKSRRGRFTTVNAVMPRMSPGGLILVDDIQDNWFFRDWTSRHGLPYRIFEFQRKFVGMVQIH